MSYVDFLAPNSTNDGKVPFHTICSCNLSNGGNGNCFCTMADNLVYPNHQSKTTNTLTINNDGKLMGECTSPNTKLHIKKPTVIEFEQKYPNLSSEFLKIQEQQYQLFAEKMLSYGIDNIAMGTSLETEEDIKLSLTSIWIRVNDKMNRLKNLVLKGNKNPLQNESTLDSWKDMTNYAIIAQLVSLGKWKK